MVYAVLFKTGLQFVSLGISCGVPQGFKYWNLCFSYINNFHNCSKILDFHLFADDANLFYKHNNID